MSPAVHDALNQFFIQVLAFGGAGLAALGFLFKAYIDRRAKKLKSDDDEALEEREQARQVELEQMRQKTAEAQQKASDAELKAEQATALTEGVANLAATMLQLIQSQNAGFHANAQALTNQAQSIGDLEQSIDRIAGAVVDNTSQQRKSIQVIDALNSKILLVFPTDSSLDTYFEQMKADILKAIRDICKDKSPDPSGGNVVPLDTPLASEEKAAS